MHLVFVILIGILTSLFGAPARAVGFGYLAFGDQRGHLEPCGCDPATDLGGARRVASFVQRERMQDPSLAVFCTGNALPPASEGKLKIPFLLEALAKAPVDACLLGALEWQSITELEKSTAKVPFVLSNFSAAAKPAAKKLTRELVEGPSFVVLGYLAPERGDRRQLVRLDAKLIARWQGLLARHQGRAKVLLFSGSDAELATVEAAQIFDTIVSANEAPLDTIVGTAEKDDEKRLERRGTRHGTMMVPLGAQGVLRGGSARSSEAKSISEIFGAGSGSGPTKLLFATAKLVTWLDLSYESESSLKDLFDRYTVAAKAVFAGNAAARIKDLATSPYIGAEACSACHPAATNVWRASKHAVAMQTLQAKKHHEDPECVACHAVGPQEKGGFVSLEASPLLAGVQCEVCHGPSKAHAQVPLVNPKPKPKVAAKDVCVTCHNAQHSPAFEPDKYWKQIAHDGK